MSQYLIYALVDPRTGERFYVGKSCKGLRRPRQHLRPVTANEQTRKGARVRELFAVGLKPVIEVLEHVADPDESLPPPLHCWDSADIAAINAREMWWIAHGRIHDWPLTNATDGGDGMHGFVVGAETRARMSKAAIGRKKGPFSDEHRANMSKAARGKKKTAEHIAKTKASRVGMKLAPEHVAKIAAANTGKIRDAKMRARLSIAIRDSPKAIAQRARLRKFKTGRKRPPLSPKEAERRRLFGESRRGIPIGHGEKIKATKALTRIGRHFALLLAGLATID